MKRKRIRKESKRSLHKKAWKLFSIYVRRNGADDQGFNTCYTCSRRFHWKELNAGHYRHDAYDFDERNVKPQCVMCNLGESGRADNYYLHLVKDYGEQEAEFLRTRKKWNDYSVAQLKELIEFYGQGGIHREVAGNIQGATESGTDPQSIQEQQDMSQLRMPSSEVSSR